MSNEAKQAKPSFVEWFDPENFEHILAYSYLEKTGMWPDGFLPEKIYIEPGWQSQIAFKMTDAWINYKLGPVRFDPR